jgi:hypothetical protein
MHTYLHSCTHTYTHSIHVQLHIFVYAIIHSVCLYAYIFACIHLFTYTYMYIKLTHAHQLIHMLHFIGHFSHNSTDQYGLFVSHRRKGHVMSSYNQTSALNSVMNQLQFTLSLFRRLLNAGYRSGCAKLLKISLYLTVNTTCIVLCVYLRLNPRLVGRVCEEVCFQDPPPHSKVKELLFHGKLHFHAARMEGVVSEIQNRSLRCQRIFEPKEEVTSLQGT